MHNYTQILSFHSRYRQKSASSTHPDLVHTDKKNLVFLFLFFPFKYASRQHCIKKTTDYAAVCMPGLSVALCRCIRKSVKVKEDMKVVHKTLVMTIKRRRKRQ